MGKSKSKKQQAKVDVPGPDDFTYLAVFFPVGRNGAAMTKDSDPADKAAAERIGMWMHHAGLPIRKLFSRKTEEHVLVEVREEIPQDVIDSKLGAYKWGDMLHSILPKDIAAESTILRAKVRSHDAVEKMGGMVLFMIPRIVPEGPRAESRFKDPFPRPRRSELSEPSRFSAIKYWPLPPQLELPPQVDVKPRIDEEEAKPDVKPKLKSEPGQDVKPGLVKEESKPLVPHGRIPNGPDGSDTKPLNVKPEEDQKPSSPSTNQLKIEADFDSKLKVKTEVKAEAGPDSSDMEIPVWDMMVEVKPKVETKAEAENAVVSGTNGQNGAALEMFNHFIHTDPTLASRSATRAGPLATQSINPKREDEDGPDSSDIEEPVWDMLVEVKPKIETKAEAENVMVSEISSNNGAALNMFNHFALANPPPASRNEAMPGSSATRPIDPKREDEDGPDSSDIEEPVWDMLVEVKPKVETKSETENASRTATRPSPLATQPIDPKREAEDEPDSSDIEIPVWDMLVEVKPNVEPKAKAENGTGVNANGASGNTAEQNSPTAQAGRDATKDGRILPIKAEASEGQGHGDPLSRAQEGPTPRPKGSKRSAEEGIDRDAAIKRERRGD
ncbi:hypothetical protein FRC08_016879 [Ceratobasidium sp. 394]|nr:hypothetical protein FRC08_016879 [Ceratobasidium sp. 394]